MKKIGLTGGIGAGKSVVSRRLQTLGAFILDADKAARAVVEPGEKGLQMVCSTFGNDMIMADGRLDRKKLASIVFQDEEALHTLNALMHPLIREWMKQREEQYIMENADGILVYDVPLLIEGGMYREMDQVWVVTADEEIRIQRIMLRDHCTAEEARQRIATQMPDEEKRKYADVLIDNSGTLQELFEQVDRYYIERRGERRS